MKNWNQFKKQLKYKLNEIKCLFGIGESKLAESKSAWLENAQQFEFSFHKSNDFRRSDEFMEETKLLFKSFGFHETDYTGQTVVDLGAGSKMRGKFFVNATHIIIEPMAEKCMQEIEWCDFKDANKVYSVPAEDDILELHNSVDFLFSINVLDHCYDFEKIIANIRNYLKPGRMAFISFDSHFSTSKGHPLILTKPFCDKIFKQNNLNEIKYTKGFPAPYYLKYPIRGYDNSSYCLNYWLQKLS